MQGPSRKILQAILYESIAVAVLSPSISLIYDEGLAHAGALSLMLSVCALLWNVLFNYVFECWEARQPQRARTLGRRLLHSLGFEGGSFYCWCHWWHGGWRFLGGLHWSPIWGCSFSSSFTRWCFSGSLIGCLMYQRPRRGRFRLTNNPRETPISLPVAVLGFVHEQCNQRD